MNAQPTPPEETMPPEPVQAEGEANKPEEKPSEDVEQSIIKNIDENTFDPDQTAPEYILTQVEAATKEPRKLWGLGKLRAKFWEQQYDLINETPKKVSIEKKRPKLTVFRKFKEMFGVGDYWQEMADYLEDAEQAEKAQAQDKAAKEVEDSLRDLANQDHEQLQLQAKEIEKLAQSILERIGGDVGLNLEALKQKLTGLQNQGEQALDNYLKSLGIQREAAPAAGPSEKDDTTESAPAKTETPPDQAVKPAETEAPAKESFEQTIEESNNENVDRWLIPMKRKEIDSEISRINTLLEISNISKYHEFVLPTHEQALKTNELLKGASSELIDSLNLKNYFPTEEEYLAAKKNRALMEHLRDQLISENNRLLKVTNQFMRRYLLEQRKLRPTGAAAETAAPAEESVEESPEVKKTIAEQENLIRAHNSSLSAGETTAVRNLIHQWNIIDNQKNPGQNIDHFQNPHQINQAIQQLQEQGKILVPTAEKPPAPEPEVIQNQPEETELDELTPAETVADQAAAPMSETVKQALNELTADTSAEDKQAEAKARQEAKAKEAEKNFNSLLTAMETISLAALRAQKKPAAQRDKDLLVIRDALDKYKILSKSMALMPLTREQQSQYTKTQMEMGKKAVKAWGKNWLPSPELKSALAGIKEEAQAETAALESQAAESAKAQKVSAEAILKKTELQPSTVEPPPASTALNEALAGIKEESAAEQGKAEAEKAAKIETKAETQKLGEELIKTFSEIGIMAVKSARRKKPENKLSDLINAKMLYKTIEQSEGKLKFDLLDPELQKEFINSSVRMQEAADDAWFKGWEKGGLNKKALAAAEEKLKKKQAAKKAA